MSLETFSIDTLSNVPTTPNDDKIRKLRSELHIAKRAMVRAKYDAAQTFTQNEKHWGMADYLDPHSSASHNVRRTLRSRARYEAIENNPYLAGTLLTVANDFTGSGPTPKITDTRISPTIRRDAERSFKRWMKLTRLRQKLWRMRLAKIVDGESFLLAYTPKKLPHPVKLNFQVIEAERVTSPINTRTKLPNGMNEVDGVRFDDQENVYEYFLLSTHPGSIVNPTADYGQWIPSDKLLHWFRQTRGWLRGIPEITPSLPLCAVLRRYTLAVVHHAEVAADYTALIESEGPPSANPYTDGAGNMVEDDPFDVFPIEIGMIANLPWGYKMRQLNPVPLGVQYDHFVGSVLREIARPILAPYNMVVGTSKDANMASAVVDQQIYKSGQEFERNDCNEVVLDHVFSLFWKEYALTNPQLAFFPKEEVPDHYYRWPKVCIDHTDPAKVANAIKTLHDLRQLTDRDIQETYYNRDVDDWREEVKDQEDWRSEVIVSAEPQEEAPEEAAEEDD